MPQSHQRVAIISVFLAATWLWAGVSCAQESRVDELQGQFEQLYAQGKYAEAVPIATEELKLAENAFGPDNGKIAVDLIDLALLYEKLGRYTEAEPL